MMDSGEGKKIGNVPRRSLLLAMIIHVIYKWVCWSHKKLQSGHGELYINLIWWAL